MNIIILHCHFERGGVTQVVENHVHALADHDDVDRVILVSGTRASGLSAETLSRVTHLVVDGFDYDSVDWICDPARLRQSLEDALAAERLAPNNTVLHWHNHSLGKNAAAPRVIEQLAVSGWRLLLQVHDFAEDNRPANYSSIIDACSAQTKSDIDRFLYPIASQVHYAALTQADASVFSALGVAADRTHCLPNSVRLNAQAKSKDEALELVRRTLDLPADATWCLYPVRGIRRKNVGEFLLLSRWLPKSMVAGLTLCPTTSVEENSYLRWRSLGETVAPQAIFDAGHHDAIAFHDNLAASEFVLSTSVAEGFGMAFLEPWLADRSVIARKLPTVVDDFVDAGVEFPMLYETIPVAGDSAWVQACESECSAAETEAWATVPGRLRPTARVAKEDRDQIDFARLTPARQAETLKRMSSDRGFESEVRARSEALIAQLVAPADKDLIRRNAEQVAAVYSPEYQSAQLVSVYHSVLASEIDGQTDAPSGSESAVDLIARARPFFPCRTEVI